MPGIGPAGPAATRAALTIAGAASAVTGTASVGAGTSSVVARATSAVAGSGLRLLQGRQKGSRINHPNGSQHAEKKPATAGGCRFLDHFVPHISVGVHNQTSFLGTMRTAKKPQCR